LPQNSLPRIGQYAQQFDVVALKQWQNTVVEQIRRGDRCLAIMELSKGNLGVSIDECLLINASDPFQLTTWNVSWGRNSRMLAFELAMSFLFNLDLSSAITWASVRTRPGTHQ